MKIVDPANLVPYEVVPLTSEEADEAVRHGTEES